MGTHFVHVHLEMPRFGEFARQLHRLRSDDVQSCLRQQQEQGGRLGEIMVQRGLISRDDLRAVLSRQAQWAAVMHGSDLAPEEFPLATPFSLCMPCYNEADVIEDCLDGACAVLPRFLQEFEIIVVDDGSTDETAEVVERYAQRDSHVRLVQHEVNQGYGAAVTTGLRAASGEWICFTDGDGQFSMLDLPYLLKKTAEADMVVGYRFDRADTAIRKLNAKSWNMLIRSLLGVRIRDLDCAFKLFPRWIVDQLKLTSAGACISAEILVQCTRGGISICEVPVHHFPRYRGEATGAQLGVVVKAFRELPKLMAYRSAPPLRVPNAGGQALQPTAQFRPATTIRELAVNELAASTQSSDEACDGQVGSEQPRGLDASDRSDVAVQDTVGPRSPEKQLQSST